MFPRHSGRIQGCGRREEECHGRWAKPGIRVRELACCAQCSQLCTDALPRLGLEIMLCLEVWEWEDTRDDTITFKGSEVSAGSNYTPGLKREMAKQSLVSSVAASKSNQ